jgi:hypothetical protein
MKKICTFCKKAKSLEEFSKTYYKHKKHTDGENRRANCRICENKRRKNTYDNNPISRMFMNAKSRARQNNIEFNITSEDVPIPKICPLLEVPLVLGSAKNYEYSPSIDRIDSTKGYIKGNVRVISLLANRMKSNSTKDQCMLFAKNIINYFN